MQFVAHGPDIPDALLQAHEDGRVVFFCGAGISYPAGLPSFKGLVEEIYRRCDTVLSDIEREAFEHGQFDATLDLLERRLPGQRRAVRRELAQSLKPKLRRKGATDTQAALLRLGRSRDGALRLVTTNFDRIFHVAAKRTSQQFQAHEAPMLPIPKKSRWDGLVYLHGLLPEKANDAELNRTELNRLVVTSGDFGLAYLTERWAARFVSELFRNYVVCFVGYSINDPVLRYMMDALAADRRLGETTPQAWALGDCEPEQAERKTIEWETKGVTPILYNVPADTDNHDALHQTLCAWANTYIDGVQGKEAIVVKHALVKPQESTQQDDFVGRVLWALSDESGIPAKRFADFNPAPSLDWLLGPFAQDRFKNADLSRFGVPPRDEVDGNLDFSLIHRPAPYDHAPSMLLASAGTTGSRWDDVMHHLARWLVRHLDDPRLVIWIAERGGQISDGLQSMIERELDRFATLERDGNAAELNEIILHSPKAIPSTAMRTLWSLLLSGRVKSSRYASDLFRWQERLKREGLTITRRLELRELLAPKVALTEPFRLRDGDSHNVDGVIQIKHLVRCELTLAADHVRSTLRNLAGDSWRSALPQLLEEFQQLLRDALDLLCELGEAGERSDRSFWHLPSITPHRQNKGYREWVVLVELLRDAWLAVHENDSTRAANIARAWFDLPYPTFKRLCLFAASHDDCIPPEQWVDWLVAEDAWWLWSIDMRREVLRLFVLQGRKLTGRAQERLEAALLAGPPRDMYRDDLEADRWQGLVDRSVWLHLAKLNTSGIVLGASAAARLAGISTDNPRWQLADNESDEFAHWISSTGDPDYEDRRKIDIAPRKRNELVQWLSKPVPEGKLFFEDTWRDVCRTRFFHSFFALCDLARKDEWPAVRWREALQVWSEEGMVLRAWRYAAPLVETMPDDVLLEIERAVTWWMEVASRSITRHETILLNLCRRLLLLETGSGSDTIGDGVETYDPVGSAINHPIGQVTQTLINLWFKQEPNDSDLLPEDLKPMFTKLCDVRVDRFRHGRVLLGSRLVAFFRVDRPWTEQHLLPLFCWDNPVEAKAAWEGFLWSPRLHQPLLIAFKSQFLDTANHYSDLGDFRQQFAVFLTYAALDRTEGYTVDEFRSAIDSLPQEGLEEAAQALAQAIEGAGDQCEDYWQNRAHPFWKDIWPKSLDLATPRIADCLTRLVIAARSEFPAALAAVQDWLQPIDHPSYVVNLLHESKLCIQNPVGALKLLDAVIGDGQWHPPKLGQCLAQIEQAKPALAQDPRYERLKVNVRKRG